VPKKKYNTADFCNFNCDELSDDTDVYNTAVYECEYEMVQNSFSWCNSPPRRYSHVGRTSNCLFDCARLVDPDLNFACTSSTFKIGCDLNHNPTERDDCDLKTILSASHRNTFISCKDNWDTCSLLDEKTNGADGQSTTYRQDINACFDTESFSNIGEKGICDINCDLIFTAVIGGDVYRESCRNLWKQNWCDCHQLPSGSEAMKQCLENYYNIENLCDVSNCKETFPDLQSWCYSFEETYLNNDEIDYLLREKGNMISNNLCKVSRASRNSNDTSGDIVVGAIVVGVIVILFCASTFRKMHQPISTVQNPAMTAPQVAMPAQLPRLSRDDQIAKIAQMTTAELKILYSDAFDRNKHQVVLEASRVLVGKPQPKPPPKKKKRKKKKTKTQGDNGESKPKKKKRKKKKQPPPPLPNEAIDDDIYLALQTVRHSIFNAQNANDSDSEDSTSDSDDDSCIDPNVSKESTMVHPRASTEEADAQLAAELAKKQSPPPRTDNLVSGECVVCLESMKVGEMVVWSETQCCNHVFHKSCMVSFLAHQRHTPAMVREDANPCPMCRQKYLTVLSADNNV